MELSVDECSVAPYDFGKNFFPCQVDGKINTLEFLEASGDVVKLIDKLGKFFSPLSSDINGNIEKIKKCYDKNPSKYVFIEDMILSEKMENNESPIDALLWLRSPDDDSSRQNCRNVDQALHFILIFFQNIIDDAMKNECLQEHISSAYSQTLKPYHRWVTRKLFGFFKDLVPNRSVLLSTITSNDKEEEKENLINFLKVYFQRMAENVNHITSFYKEHNLDSNATV